MINKAFIIKHEYILSKIYRIMGSNRLKIKGRQNRIDFGNAFMRKSRINIIGNNNSISITSGLTRLNHVNITVIGSNCSIRIGSKYNLNHLSIYIEDDCGKVEIGEHVTITGNTHLDVIEGTRITIGNDCLFSSDIHFRTGDSHSILDITSGNRINPSLNINIGDHVWIGHSVKVLKGAYIKSDSIAATNAIVTKCDFPSNAIIGGCPAKVLKTGINWNPHRLPVE